MNLRSVTRVQASKDSSLSFHPFLAIPVSLQNTPCDYLPRCSVCLPSTKHIIHFYQVHIASVKTLLRIVSLSYRLGPGLYGDQLPGYPNAYPKLFPRIAGLGLQNVGCGISLMADFRRRLLDLTRFGSGEHPESSTGIMGRSERAGGPGGRVNEARWEGTDTGGLVLRGNCRCSVIKRDGSCSGCGKDVVT